MTLRVKRPLHILLMDDDVEFAFNLRSELEQFYQLSWCRSASDSLDVLDRYHVDLVIADIFVYQNGAPVADGGITLISTMRISRFRTREKDCSEIPIIAISAAPENIGDLDFFSTASNLGANAVMEKPIDVPALLSLIQSLPGLERGPLVIPALQSCQ